MTLPERFWAKVEKSDYCWVWTASTNHGYGQISVANKPRKAHRVSLHLAGVDVPAGWHVHHLCENRRCVRPDHLTAVETQSEHSEFHRTGCVPHGEADIRQVQSGRNVGMRYCAICNREKAARRRRARGVAPRSEWLDARFGEGRPRREQAA